MKAARASGASHGRPRKGGRGADASGGIRGEASFSAGETRKEPSPAAASVGNGTDNGNVFTGTTDSQWRVLDDERTVEKIGFVGLAISLFLAAMLRIHRLDDVPTGLYIDEVAISVEARSLGQTMSDVDGNFLPLFPSAQFSSSWGYNGMIYQPIYVYSKILFEWILPSGVSSVRLPSVLWGMCGVAAGVVLSSAVLADLHFAARWTGTTLMALLLAVSPWHHHFSRLGFEVISCPVFITSGAYLLVMCAHNNLIRPGRSGSTTADDPASQHQWLTGRLVAGLLVMLASAYAYHTARLFAPLLAVAYCWWFLIDTHDWRSRLRILVLLSIVFAVVILLPLGVQEVGRMQAGDAKPAAEWFRRNVIFTTNFERMKQMPGFALLEKLCAESGPCWADFILDHQLIGGIYLFCYNYVTYLSPSFIFLCKDTNRRHSLSGSGVLLWPEAVLLLLGVLWLLANAMSGPASRDGGVVNNEDGRRRYRVSLSRFLLSWLLLWPLPASLCMQTPHAIRSFVAVPIFELTMAYGVGHSVQCLVTSGRKRAARALDSVGSIGPRQHLQAALSWATGTRTGGMLSVVVCLLYTVWLILAVGFYQHRYFTQYANESLKNFNFEATIDSFRDVKEAGYFNKSRVLVSQNIDNSFAYILYSEEVDLRCLHCPSCTDLNSKLKACRLPYEIVHQDVAHEYTLTSSDLLLIDVRSLKRYPEAIHDRLQLLKQWYNYHGAVQLKSESIVDPDIVDDEDEF